MVNHLLHYFSSKLNRNPKTDVTHRGKTKNKYIWLDTQRGYNIVTSRNSKLPFILRTYKKKITGEQDGIKGEGEGRKDDKRGSRWS